MDGLPGEVLGHTSWQPHHARLVSTAYWTRSSGPLLWELARHLEPCVWTAWTLVSHSRGSKLSPASYRSREASALSLYSGDDRGDHLLLLGDSVDCPMSLVCKKSS